MAEFDPYHKWLGIPPKDQPPNHYRLLAIDLFESDSDVIDAAANKQMSYLQTCVSGPNISLSQRLLNEVAAARLCLLTKKTKVAYDSELKKTLEPAQVSSESPSPQPTKTSSIDDEFDLFRKHLDLPQQQRQRQRPSAKGFVGLSSAAAEDSVFSRQHIGIISAIVAVSAIVTVLSISVPWKRLNGPPDRPTAVSVKADEPMPSATSSLNASEKKAMVAPVAVLLNSARQEVDIDLSRSLESEPSLNSPRDRPTAKSDVVTLIPKNEKSFGILSADSNAKTTDVDRPSSPAKKTTNDSKKWIVIFRSADPSIWNTDENRDRNHMALSSSKVPDRIRYLKLARADKDFVIVEMSKDKLFDCRDDGVFGWQGKKPFKWNARQLGIYNKAWGEQVKGYVNTLALGGQGFRGWGFGVRIYIDDKQGYSWAGEESQVTVFEIAVTSDALTENESSKLLKKSGKATGIRPERRNLRPYPRGR